MADTDITGEAQHVSRAEYVAHQAVAATLLQTFLAPGHDPRCILILAEDLIHSHQPRQVVFRINLDHFGTRDMFGQVVSMLDLYGPVASLVLSAALLMLVGIAFAVYAPETFRGRDAGLPPNN